MRRIILTIWFVVLIFRSSTIAENKYFYESGQILPGEQWDNVFVYNDPTVVDMLGGTIVNGIFSYNASTVNVTEGNIDGIGSYSTSTINIYGGHVNTFDALEFSTVNVSGGYVYGLFGKNQSIITLSGIASGMNFGVEDWSVLNVSGGTLNYLGAMEYGTLNISKVIVNDSLSARDSSMVNIFGHNLMKVSAGGYYGYGRVYGYWQDWTPFNINLNGPETYSRINLIPEPATILLLGFGTLILRRKK